MLERGFPGTVEEYVQLFLTALCLSGHFPLKPTDQALPAQFTRPFACIIGSSLCIDSCRKAPFLYTL
jgi:hypothetical protein